MCKKSGFILEIIEQVIEFEMWVKKIISMAVWIHNNIPFFPFS
jgi:hypothetical protein